MGPFACEVRGARREDRGAQVTNRHTQRTQIESTQELPNDSFVSLARRKTEEEQTRDKPSPNRRRCSGRLGHIRRHFARDTTQSHCDDGRVTTMV